MLADQIIPCIDCGTEFTFTAREQEFYAQKGFASPPKRCKPCRNSRKEQQQSRDSSGAYVSANYASSGGGGYGGGGGGGYGGGGGGGGYPPRERQLHDVTCAACGTPTQVPFKPRGDRPVYCRSCFQK